MPEKPALPSIRGIAAVPAAVAVLAPPAAAAVAPATVTVKARGTSPIVSVYVVVALGVILAVPRGGTAPTPLSMVGVPASVAQDRTTDSPGLMELGVASKRVIRGVIGARPPLPACAGAAPCAG